MSTGKSRSRTYDDCVRNLIGSFPLEANSIREREAVNPNERRRLLVAPQRRNSFFPKRHPDYPCHRSTTDEDALNVFPSSNQ